MARCKGPGRSERKGITLIQLMDMFPDEESATRWFEEQVWGETGRYCGHCGNVATSEVPNARPMPYWCRDCRSYFSVRTGTPIAHSRVQLRKWAIAVYLCATGLKGVSSMKLHRDLGVTQKTAWFMLHRLRKAWDDESGDKAEGPVEIDEAYIGGKEKNKHESRKLKAGRGTVGKIPVIGIKDRKTRKIAAKPVMRANREVVESMIKDRVSKTAKVYTDESKIYSRLGNRETVNHSAGEYVRDEAHVNGMESFWSMFRRGYYGTYHRMSPKHLHRYVDEFTGRHNIRDLDTIDQMRSWVAGLIGKRLMYKQLVQDGRST